MPNGATMPRPYTCKHCWFVGTNFDKCCKNCKRCISCGRIGKRHYKENKT